MSRRQTRTWQAQCLATAEKISDPHANRIGGEPSEAASVTPTLLWSDQSRN
ncbi:MAG UNVERIFIED_CONTAM: hypothetical protein LVR18_19735 [Planctomycetaceae bacterium]